MNQIKLKKKSKNIWPLFLIIKYSFSVVITFLAFTTVQEIDYLVISLLELVTILAFSYAVLSRNRLIGHSIHFLLLLVYNLQTLVMYFGGSFTTFIMINNLASINGLSGEFGAYFQMAIPLLVCTCIPAKRIILNKRWFISVLASSIVVEVVICILIGNAYSPLYNVYDLYVDLEGYQKAASEIENLSVNSIDFYHEEIVGAIDKPKELPENPNIILIFVEGLSDHVINDSRNIMPNMQAFEDVSLHFDNYYNHTFATYRGLIGQLYSGYQFDNYDTNPLCSIQSILKEKGYQTAVINTEPTNSDFTEYLTSFQFDEVVSEPKYVDSSNGYIPDKDAYELLYDTVIEQNQKEQPFFTTIYTFGTHVTLDSPDEQYGDGTNPALNKFFNTDFQFGIFLERFRESELYDNTLLILTSDHATCADDDFRSTFSDYSRQSFGLDKIPFCIYHKGIEARVIDANGRNSLCIAPTLLDYLDISEPNYFLGTSLFVSDYDESKYSTTFYYPGEILSTVGGEIKELSEEDYLDFWGKLTMYFAATNNDDLMDISAIVSDDCSNLTITFSSEQEYPNIWFYVWSQENGQDDLACYQAVKENNSWTYTVDLGKHGSKGAYYVHVYEGKERPEQILIDTLPYIPNYPPYHLEIETSKDCSKVDIALSNTGNYVNFLFPIWSEANGQDDIVWYQPEKDENGIWRCVIDVADHSDSISSSLVIHVYGKLQEQDEYKFITNSILNFEKDGL